MELRETVELMNSTDYKDRFKAEYLQLKIRYSKLWRMVVKYKAGVLDFVPSCSLEVLIEQLRAMGNYIMLLETRAMIENIPL